MRERAGSTEPDCPHMRLLELFRKKAPSRPRPRSELWSGKKADNLKARWRWVLTARRENGQRYAETEDEAVEWFGRFFEDVEDSEFLSGRAKAQKWCTLEWLVKKDNFDKVVEGNYRNEAAE